jgi:hypothetical protein
LCGWLQAVNTLAAERRIEKSQVQYISTSGSTYTVLWDVHAWESHISIYRYVRHICNWHLSTTARMVAPVAVTMTLWATLICVAKPLAQERLGIKLTMPMAPLTLVSSALALLLTLRTNQSLTRLLEARLAWGKLVLHARVLAGFLATRVYPINPGLALLAGRLLCYVAWSSRASLVPVCLSLIPARPHTNTCRLPRTHSTAASLLLRVWGLGKPRLARPLSV